MNVSLTPKLDQFIGAKVASGRYSSASEVVREALRLLEERDEERVEQLSAFRHEIVRRTESLDQGQHVKPPEARTRLEQKSQAMRSRSA